MIINLTKYEKDNGVKLFISPDTYIFKFILKDKKIVIICRYKNCLNKGDLKYNTCDKHKPNTILQSSDTTILSN